MPILYGIYAEGKALTILAIAGLGASYLPSRRASRIDPIRTLRHE